MGFIFHMIDSEQKLYHPCASKISDTNDGKEVMMILAMANKWDLTTMIKYCTINNQTSNIMSTTHPPPETHTQRNLTAQFPKDSSNYIKNCTGLKRRTKELFLLNV